MSATPNSANYPLFSKPTQRATRTPHFDGETYLPGADHARLTGQLAAVYAAMAGGSWLTLAELRVSCPGTEAAVSARLRDLRKRKFGGHVVERRHRGPPRDGLYEYRLIP